MGISHLSTLSVLFLQSRPYKMNSHNAHACLDNFWHHVKRWVHYRAVLRCISILTPQEVALHGPVPLF